MYSKFFRTGLWAEFYIKKIFLSISCQKLQGFYLFQIDRYKDQKGHVENKHFVLRAATSLFYNFDRLTFCKSYENASKKYIVCHRNHQPFLQVLDHGSLFFLEFFNCFGCFLKHFITIILNYKPPQKEEDAITFQWPHFATSCRFCLLCLVPIFN